MASLEDTIHSAVPGGSVGKNARSPRLAGFGCFVQGRRRRCHHQRRARADRGTPIQRGAKLYFAQRLVTCRGRQALASRRS
jgi:hypothetical protein